MSKVELSSYSSALVRRGDTELVVSKEVYNGYHGCILDRLGGIPKPRSLRGEPLRYAGRIVRMVT